MKNENHPVVRCIDVGFGNTKFTTCSYDAGAGCDLIPSLAPISGKTNKFKDNFMKSGDVDEVVVDGTRYVVGKDAHTAATTTTVRVLDPAFPLTNVYAALIKGALVHMNVVEIDLLVLGLPMNSYDLYKHELSQKMRGSHVIPNFQRKQSPFCPAEISCTANNVIVVPQPIGAFLNYSVPRGINEDMVDETNLVIDVGRGTLDWFISRGNKPIKPRCGATFGGVSKIALAVANEEGQKVRENLALMDRIETALHTRQMVHIAGEAIDIFQKHQRVIENSIAGPVSAMFAGIGDADDIANILVTGGGANLYLPQLQNALGKRTLIVDDDPIFSNVKGFQLAGEQYMQDLLSAAA